MTQQRKKVNKKQPKQRFKPQDNSPVEPLVHSNKLRAAPEINRETAAKLKQLVNNLQELHAWEGTILQQLGDITDSTD